MKMIFYLSIIYVSDAKSTEKLQTLDWKYLMVGSNRWQIYGRNTYNINF